MWLLIDTSPGELLLQISKWSKCLWAFPSILMLMPKVWWLINSLKNFKHTGISLKLTIHLRHFKSSRQTDKSSSSGYGFWWGFLFCFFWGGEAWEGGRRQRMEPIMQLKVDQNLEEKSAQTFSFTELPKKIKIQTSQDLFEYKVGYLGFYTENVPPAEVSVLADSVNSWIAGRHQLSSPCLIALCRHFCLISSFIKQYSLQTENKYTKCMLWVIGPVQPGNLIQPEMWTGPPCILLS